MKTTFSRQFVTTSVILLLALLLLGGAFRIVVQQPTRKAFNPHAGLTYDYMEDFIKSIAPERLPEFQAIRVTYRSYPAVKRWFLEAFPEVNENLWFAA